MQEQLNILDYAEKGENMKKFTAILTAAVLFTVTCVSGCGSAASSATTAAPATTKAASTATTSAQTTAKAAETTNAGTGTTAAAASTTAAAAGSKGASEGTTVTPKDMPARDDLKGVKIADCVLLEDQFQRMLQITMKKTAEKYGAEVVEGHSNGELDKEVAEVNNLSTSGINAMAIFPVSATEGSIPALEAAAKNGIKIYCVNDNTGRDDIQIGNAQMDQYGIGVSIGKYAREYITKNFPNKKPKVCIMQFKALMPELSKKRTDGFLSETQDLIEIVQDVDAWDSDKSVNVAAEVMNAHPDLDMFFVMNEGGAVGTVMAIKNAGKKNVKVFGIDASEQLANMLLDPDDILQAICGQDPISLGTVAMENLCLYLMGKPYKTGVELPGIPLTREKPDEINAYIKNLKEVLGE